MNRTLRCAAELSLMATIAVTGAMLVACGSGESSPAPTQSAATTIAWAASPAPNLSGTITILAASSLTDAFNQEAAAFQKAHPGVAVKFSFSGSPTLVTQLDQGAPADVVATADEKNMKAAADRALVVEPARIFVRNRLVIAVPRSNPAQIASPNDLAKPNLKLVLAGKDVPAGDYARQSLKNMEADAAFGAGFSDKVLKNLVSEEPNVKSVVSKIQLGEADAGIVYQTDITAGVARDVSAVEIPDSFNVIASYPIAITSKAGTPAIAAAFIDFILSAEGQKILADNGFEPVR